MSDQATIVKKFIILSSFKANNTCIISINH